MHPKLHSGDSCNLTWVPPRSDAKGLLWVLVIQGLWPLSRGALTLYGKYIHGLINYKAAIIEMAATANGSEHQSNMGR